MTTTQSNLIETLSHAKAACFDKYMDCIEYGLTADAQIWWDRYVSYKQELADHT